MEADGAKKSDSGSLNSVTKKISVGTVIFFLLATLMGVGHSIGKHYSARLEAVEGSDKTQGEQFHKMDVELREIKMEQRYMKEEQRSVRTVLERIDAKLK